MLGFIGIDRGLRDHWIYQDAEYLKVWMEMLFLARYSDEPHNELIDGDLVTVGYGQFIYGRVKWSERLKISEQRLRTLITKLKKAKMIDVVDTHRKCSVYEILNYAKFNHQDNHHSNHTHQGISVDANHQVNQLPTSSQPAANQQPTTKEQSKQRKQGKQSNKDINLKEYAEFVHMSEIEYQKLIDGHGELITQLCIEKLDNHKGATGQAYKSDYRAILKWVVGAVKKDQAKIMPFPKGGQAHASKPESRRQSTTAEYNGNDAQGTDLFNLQNAAVSGGNARNSELDLDKFVRR